MTQRLCFVIGTAGLAVFLIAAAATFDDTRWITEPIALGGLVVAFLAALVAGLHWVITEKENPDA